MTALKNQKIRLNNLESNEDSLANSVKILSDISLRDIERLYNANSTNGTEAYYSNRYGTILRRTID